MFFDNFSTYDEALGWLTTQVDPATHALVNPVHVNMITSRSARTLRFLRTNPSPEQAKIYLSSLQLREKAILDALTAGTLTDRPAADTALRSICGSFRVVTLYVASLPKVTHIHVGKLVIKLARCDGRLCCCHDDPGCSDSPHRVSL